MATRLLARADGPRCGSAVRDQARRRDSGDQRQDDHAGPRRCKGEVPLPEHERRGYLNRKLNSQLISARLAAF